MSAVFDVMIPAGIAATKTATNTQRVYTFETCCIWIDHFVPSIRMLQVLNELIKPLKQCDINIRCKLGLLSKMKRKIYMKSVIQTNKQRMRNV